MAKNTLINIYREMIMENKIIRSIHKMMKIKDTKKITEIKYKMIAEDKIIETVSKIIVTILHDINDTLKTK